MFDKVKETAEALKQQPPRRQVDAVLGCPFCGEENTLWKNCERTNEGLIYGYRFCRNCEAKGPWTEITNDSLLWNMRAT